MATLKEAAESGRRWRHPGLVGWLGPGRLSTPAAWSLDFAISSDFEIEPEKPREWWITGRAVDGMTSHYILGKDPLHPIRVHDADACEQRRCPNFKSSEDKLYICQGRNRHVGPHQDGDIRW